LRKIYFALSSTKKGRPILDGLLLSSDPGRIAFIFYASPTNIANCASQDSVTIVVEETNPLTVDAVASTESIDCPGDPVDFVSTASGGVPGYNYQWIELVGNNSNIVNSDSAFTANPNINDFYSYIVQVTDFCDEIAFDTLMVEVNLPDPLSVEDEVLCVGSGGQLNITGGSGNYFLSSELLEFDNPSQPNFPTNNAGIFQILIADQCSAIQPVTALVEINGCSINVPNIFTPNGDNKNDALVFEGLLDYPNGSTLIVKNRWGKEVYSSTSYQNDWSPRDLPEGTYYFILQTTLDEDIAGYITLTR
jgi:gliding motility-associated-like protein